MNSTHKGDDLEKDIGALLSLEIEEGRFWAKKECCALFNKKPYYSRDRGSNITFDLSIEIRIPGSEQYSVLVLIECKNYKNPVGVEDVEEFYSKVQQVAGANVKGILATTSSFRSGALAYAKSKGFGLLRYFGSKNFKWELHRSPSTKMVSGDATDTHGIQAALLTENYRSTTYDLFGQTAVGSANSLWQFFSDLIPDALFGSTGKQIKNSKKTSSTAPYLTKQQITNIATELLEEISYKVGEVPLEHVVESIRSKGALVVHYLPTQAGDVVPQILGKITFEPPEIHIHRQRPGSRGRERFTLAHELGHYLLAHHKFLKREYCEQDDLDVSKTRIRHEIPEIDRMEWQANYFATSLLMPQGQVETMFWKEIDRLHIPNKGHGPLFVDKQPYNLDNYYVVTNTLKAALGVSRMAIACRLEEFGLLNDSRGS